METVNRTKIVEKVYPILLEKVEQGVLSDRLIQDTVAAMADGYSFPTNLDSDPPIGGNVPVTAQQLVHEALGAKRPLTDLMQSLAAYAERRTA